MLYYPLFQLVKEPFSNSPDPDLFFHSIQHHEGLQKLELSIRLRRGLSVVIGDIGTGKSTMCRKLLRLIDDESGVISAHLILDPEFTSPLEFLVSIVKTLGIDESDCSSEWQMKEAIKNYLFHQGIDRNKIPVLIIDEGQKLPAFCLEILREFLNFETNQNKLLQIVIFAQEEFEGLLKNKPNFTDRIATYHKLVPLSFNETKQMIRYRIEQCQQNSSEKQTLFPLATILIIFLISKGYPRKIVTLCSKILLSMLVKNKKKAGIFMVFNAVRETPIPVLNQHSKRYLLAACLLLFLLPVFLLWNKAFWGPPDIGTHSVPLAASIKKPLAESLPEANHPVENNSQKPPSSAMVSAPAAIIAQKPPAEVPPDLKSRNSLPDKIPAETLQAAQLKNEDEAKTEKQPAPFPSALPEHLGHLLVLDGTSLSKMVARVYGKYSEYRVRMVLEANPDIADPASIMAESRVLFPRLRYKGVRKLIPYIVQLGRFDSLQEAYDFIIAYPVTEETAIIVPLWDGVSQLTFLVIIERNFVEQDEAREFIAGIEEPFRSGASILDGVEGTPI